MLAGPGSGKTRVITHRVAYLLRERCPAVANPRPHVHEQGGRRNAAPLARARRDAGLVEHLPSLLRRLLAAICRVVGLRKNFTIYDTNDGRQALKRVIEAHDIETLHYTPERIASAICWAKNNLITADRYEPKPGQPSGPRGGRGLSGLPGAAAARPRPSISTICCCTWPRCCARIPRFAAASTIAIATSWSTSIRTRTWPSTSIVRALSIDHPNLAVTGDPDQSIYGWRGANLNNILEFEQRLSRRASRAAGAELSQHEAHPARGRRS